MLYYCKTCKQHVIGIKNWLDFVIECVHCERPLAKFEPPNTRMHADEKHPASSVPCVNGWLEYPDLGLQEPCPICHPEAG